MNVASWPEFYSLGAHTYKVELGQPDPGCLANLNREALQVVIEPGLPKTRYLATLLHEFAHLWVDPFGLDEDLNERIIDAVAEGFSELGNRNPHFLQDWLENYVERQPPREHARNADLDRGPTPAPG